jgi:hypothetical protein
VKCSFCGGSFKERGINIHISKAHPEKGREHILYKYNVGKTSLSSHRSENNCNDALNVSKIKNPFGKDKNEVPKKRIEDEFNSELESWIQKFMSIDLCDKIGTN